MPGAMLLHTEAHVVLTGKGTPAGRAQRTQWMIHDLILPNAQQGVLMFPFYS